MKVKRMKAKHFASGESAPQPLDLELFKFECEHVLGMNDLEEEDLYRLAQYLIEHYYLIDISQREYLRYSVVEA